MKAIFLTLLFCLGIIVSSTGQNTETESQQTTQELYDFHIQKKKANNLGGWLTLGSGLTMVIGAGLITYSDGGNHDDLAISGGVIALSSIYFFERAGHHKKNANIQLKNGAVGLNNEFKYSGISITFTF